MSLSSLPEPALFAFVDESIRGSTYLMCAVLVAPRDLTTVRRALVALRLPGQERVHLYKESHARRRTILDRIARQPLRARIYIATGNLLRARDACMRTMVPDLHKQRATRLVIESVDSLVAQDRASVRKAMSRLAGDHRPLVEHMEPRLEPLLWAADAIAWAHGAKGDWRRRVDGLIEARIDLRKREARITSVRRRSGPTS